MLVAGNSSRVWERLFGLRAPDSVHGLCGLLASVLALYNSYAFKHVSLDEDESENSS